MRYTVNCSIYNKIDLNAGEKNDKTGAQASPLIKQELFDRYTVDIKMPAASTSADILVKIKEWILLGAIPDEEHLYVAKETLDLTGTNIITKSDLTYVAIMPLKNI